MEEFLTYTILGLVLGAVYAIAASGLVLTYTCLLYTSDAADE